MSSTLKHVVRANLRRLTLAGVALMTGASLVGCTFKTVERPPEPVAEPKGQDPMYAMRQWPPQEAAFANSSTVTYRNRFRYGYDREPDKVPYTGIITTPLVSFIQTLALPISFLRNPPGTKETNSQMTYQPTYTAMPARPDPAENPLAASAAPATRPSGN